MTDKHLVVSVEDDLGIFAIIQATLTKLPIDLYHASNGNDALELIKKHEPRLVILDISLPDMNGVANGIEMSLQALQASTSRPIWTGSLGFPQQKLSSIAMWFGFAPEQTAFRIASSIPDAAIQ